MKVVIDIPKVLYERANKPPTLGMYEEIIAKGIPLPKGHGKLIDANDLLDNTCLDEIPTIIEADTESEG